MQNVAQTIEEISSASESQAESVKQVNEGIGQISSVVQSNSATAEQSAAASEELSSQAQILNDLVGRFILRAETVISSSKSAVTALGHDLSLRSDDDSDKY